MFENRFTIGFKMGIHINHTDILLHLVMSSIMKKDDFQKYHKHNLEKIKQLLITTGQSFFSVFIFPTCASLWNCFLIYYRRALNNCIDSTSLHSLSTMPCIPDIRYLNILRANKLSVCTCWAKTYSYKQLWPFTMCHPHSEHARDIKSLFICWGAGRKSSKREQRLCTWKCLVSKAQSVLSRYQ